MRLTTGRGGATDMVAASGYRSHLREHFAQEHQTVLAESSAETPSDKIQSATSRINSNSAAELIISYADVETCTKVFEKWNAGPGKGEQFHGASLALSCRVQRAVLTHLP